MEFNRIIITTTIGARVIISPAGGYSVERRIGNGIGWVIDDEEETSILTPDEIAGLVGHALEALAKAAGSVGVGNPDGMAEPVAHGEELFA